MSPPPDSLPPPSPLRLPLTVRVLDEAIAPRIFPGAVVEIGRHDAAIATVTRGALTYADGAPAVSERTVYDLASLTKVLATTALVLHEVEAGRMRLDDPVRRWIASWTGDERQAVTLQDLLEHGSGLPAHRRYFESMRGRAAFEAAICEARLDSEPRARSTYSDLGFMLLGFVLETAGHAPLDRLFDTWRDREHGDHLELRFRPPVEWRDRTAPTEEIPPRGQFLDEDVRLVDAQLVVHDENAAALGGVAGHAGLFATAAAVGACARWWLRRLGSLPSIDVAWSFAARFAQKSLVPGSSRALGWDTMLPTSSCGTRLSPRAIGHTGFTGTSLWIDPGQDLYVVFLSNRVHPTRDGDGMPGVRPALHDAVLTELKVKS